MSVGVQASAPGFPEGFPAKGAKYATGAGSGSGETPKVTAGEQTIRRVLVLYTGARLHAPTAVASHTTLREHDVKVAP
jgi:hypothetical protein